MRLAQFVRGRDNNFNLIRLIAALAVLVSHSFALAAGNDFDPLSARLGMNLGGIAVDIFFITSGFLVTNSLIARKSTLKFVWARVLRIYPALLVAVLLMACVLGPFFTTQPVASYFASRQTFSFLLRNLTLVSGVSFHLPGVFRSVPYGGVVNGALWTMVYEVRMYVMLALMWPALYVLGGLREKAFTVCVALIGASAFLLRFANYYYFHSEWHFDFIRLLFMFFTGATYYVLRERIVLSRGVFLLALGGIIISAVNKEIFFGVYNIALAYVLFWLAYIPGGAIRNFNRLGDYSYGVYIYAFPIQQSILALFPGVTVAGLIATATVATLCFASLSWHLIEKKALRLKGISAGTPRPAVGLALQPVQPQAQAGAILARVNEGVE